MSANNLSAGFASGLNAGSAFAARKNDGERRSRLDALALEDRDRQITRQDRSDSYFREDRERRHASEDIAAQNNEMDRAEARIFREEQQARQDRLDAEAREDRDRRIREEDAMLPVQRQIQRLQLKNEGLAHLDAQNNRRLAKQQENIMESAGLINEAQAFFEGGDYQSAAASYRKLGKYGYDVQKMSDGGATTVRNAVEGLLSGEVSINDPKVMEATKLILSPALAQSGRDMNKFEVHGLIPIEDNSGDFMVAIRDKKTNEIKPVTLFASSEDADVPTRVSAEDLQVAASKYIDLSTSAMQTQLRAAGARMGMDVGSVDQATGLEAVKLQAQIKKLNAETAAVDGAGRTVKSAEERFVESYAEFPGMEAVAKLIVDEPNFDPEQAIETVSGVRMIMESKEYDRLPPIEALQVYRSNQEIERKIIGHVEEIMSTEEGLDLFEVEKLVRSHHENPNPNAYERRLKRLKDTRDRKAARAKTRKEVENENRIDMRGGEDDSASLSDRFGSSTSVLDEVAATARGY